MVKLFLSVGSRFPMDRLIKMVDTFLVENPEYQGSAQIGESQYQSQRLKTQHWYSADEFATAISEADVFISHAGIGNIMLAQELNKAIILIPRMAKYGEHINNHQIGTTQGFKDRDFVKSINCASELASAIDWARNWPNNKACNNNRNELITRLTNFLDQ